MDLHANLAKLNLILPKPAQPVGAYVPAVRSGNLIFVSGQLPWSDGKLLATGKVPSAVSLEQGQLAARQCALNALAIVDAQLGGDWSHFVRVVRLVVFVACDDGFPDQPKVANGASEFLVQVLGDAGRHARAAVGCNALPLGASVEAEVTVEVR